MYIYIYIAMNMKLVNVYVKNIIVSTEKFSLKVSQPNQINMIYCFKQYNDAIR